MRLERMLCGKLETSITKDSKAWRRRQVQRTYKVIVTWWPRTCVLEARSERSNFEGPPIPWKSSSYFHFFWSKLAMQVVLCVERLTIFSIWCFIMEEATAMTGTKGFLGESSWGPLTLCFLTASTDKSYLATSTFDSKVAGLELPSGGW